MTPEEIRMHLVQAITRAQADAVREHLRVALQGFDEHYPSAAPTDHGSEPRIEHAEVELEAWLVRHAKHDVPELVLKSILRDYADRLDTLGHVPRAWEKSDLPKPGHDNSPNGR